MIILKVYQHQCLSCVGQPEHLNCHPTSFILSNIISITFSMVVWQSLLQIMYGRFR